MPDSLKGSRAEALEIDGRLLEWTSDVLEKKWLELHHATVPAGA